MPAADSDLMPLRHVLHEKLNIGEVGTIWFDVFNEPIGDELPREGKDACLVALLSRAQQRTGAFSRILTSIQHNRADLYPEVAKLLAPFLPSPAPADTTPERRITPPQPTNHFTGRDDVLEGIAASLKDKGRVALVGTPGVGKTQTAAKYAADNAPSYRHLFWLPADSLLTLQAGYATLAGALVDPAWKTETDQERAAGAALDWLNKESDWLLVLDNADDLSALRSEWLPAKGVGHLLVTTRNPAAARVAPVVTVHKMSVEDGANCLLRCAAIADPIPEQRTAAQEISRAMDGLPLALDQAGAYIVNTGRSITQYRGLFLGKNRGRLLNARGVELTGDERTVFSTFTLAVDQVGERQPAALELLRLCVFFAPDDIPEFLFTKKPEALGKKLGRVAADPVAWDEMLGAVRALALIERGEGGETFSLHRLLLEVVRETMKAKQQEQQVAGAISVLINAWPPSGDFLHWKILDQLQPHQFVCINAAKHRGIDTPALANLLNQAAFHLASRAAFEKAEPLYRRALEIRERQLGPKHPDTATSLNNLAGLLDNRGNWGEAEPLFRRALEIWERQLGPKHPNTANILNNLAGLLEKRGNWEEAEPLYRRALEIRERQLGPQHPNTAGSLNNLASLLDNRGNWGEAEPLYRRALEIYERQLGPEHPSTALSLNNLANLLNNRGNWGEAEPLYRRALEIRERQLGPEHPDTALSLNNLALLLNNCGNWGEAEPLYRRALEIYERQLGPEHPSTANSLNNLALLLDNRGNWEEAEPLYRRALEIWERQLGPDHPSTANSLSNMATFHYQRGQHALALPLLERAIRIWEATLGPEHPNTINGKQGYAVVAAAMQSQNASEPCNTVDRTPE